MSKDIQTFTQATNAAMPLTFDWTAACVIYWRPGRLYDPGDRVRPTVANGYEYECQSTGQTSGMEEPDWSVAPSPNLVVQDGSVTWVCKALSSSTLVKTVSSQSWSGTGLTFSSQTVVNDLGEQSTTALVSATVSGTYTAKNLVVFSDGSTDGGLAYIEVV